MLETPEEEYSEPLDILRNILFINTSNELHITSPAVDEYKNNSPNFLTTPR